nr:sphingomyelin phosphodiesterase 5 isoform X1 [Marmota flaviventris]
MQTQSDWPPVTDDILRPSPFAHPGLHTLHCVARVLLFPTYWALDQLIGCWAPTARPSRLRAAAGGGVALLLLLLVGLPLALPGLLLWLPLQACRRPFCYQPPPPCWVPPTPWRPCAEFARCFVFLTANLCLLPDGLARFSNLPHSQQRAEAIGATLLNGLRPSLYGATGCSPQRLGEPGGTLTAQMPAGLDFVCLQEVFDIRAARRLVRCLAPNLGPVLYDVGTLGLQPGPYLKLLGSGLLLASRYPLLRANFRCFPNARREDSFASKGLLSAQVYSHRLCALALDGMSCWAEWAMKAGTVGGVAGATGHPGRAPRSGIPALHAFTCTHCNGNSQEVPGWVQRPQSSGNQVSRMWILNLGRIEGGTPLPPPSTPSVEDGLLRCKQLTLLLDWAEQFEAESRQSGEAVAFSVLLGDLNFDNCSKDHAQEQGHKLFRCFRDPCRLSTRQDQPWALGTILSTSTLHQSVASSPEMLRRALEQEKGRHLYLAGPPRGGRRANPWLGRRLDYITYREMPGSVLIPVSARVQDCWACWHWNHPSTWFLPPGSGTGYV